MQDIYGIPEISVSPPEGKNDTKFILTIKNLEKDKIDIEIFDDRNQRKDYRSLSNVPITKVWHSGMGEYRHSIDVNINTNGWNPGCYLISVKGTWWEKNYEKKCYLYII